MAIPSSIRFRESGNTEADQRHADGDDANDRLPPRDHALELVAAELAPFLRAADRGLDEARQEIPFQQPEQRADAGGGPADHGRPKQALCNLFHHHPPTGAVPVKCSTAATATTITSEIGRNTFQPSRMSWS